MTVNAGDGSPGTYRTSYPARSDATRCKLQNRGLRDAFEATLTVSERTLTLKASAPGFGMIQCDKLNRLGRLGAVWSFTGTLVQ